jgi:hypothetical protein
MSLDDFKINYQRNPSGMNFRYSIGRIKHIVSMQESKGKSNIGFRRKAQNHFEHFNIVIFNDICNNHFFIAVLQLEE